jgi:hypothetical protein
MIISWFTQPQNSFASYYQYDTTTTQFVRVRLELGRQSSSGRTNDTFASYKAERYVGFSTEKYSTSDLSKWSVNDEGDLCYTGQPLKGGKPDIGDKVYDCSNPSSFVHRGNPVTNDPALPPGIEAKHLALLANEAFVSKNDIALTGGDATGQALAEAIESEVCKIVGVETFAEVTDEKILATLKSQVKQISGDAVDEHAEDLADALTSAEDANKLISEQIEEGAFTPNQAFEEAFANLQAAIGKAQAASGGAADLTQALAGINEARQSLNTAIQNIDSVQHDAVAKQLETARDALASAEQNATTWEEVQAEYKPLADTESVEAYEKEIGIENEEMV